VAVTRPRLEHEGRGEGRPWTAPSPAVAHLSLRSGRVAPMTRLGPPRRACRGATGGPGGPPTAAGTWPHAWGCLARRAAAGGPSTPPAGDPPAGPPRSPPAPPAPWRPRSSPGVRRPAAVQRASRRRRRGARGWGAPAAWRAAIPPCRPGGGRAAAPRAQGRARAPPHTPEALPAFQPTGQAQRRRALPAPNTRPARGCSPGERRCGWPTVRRRRLTASGVPPVGRGPPGLAGCDGHGAGEPTPGARGSLAGPSRHPAGVQRLAGACAPAFPARLHRRRLGRRGAPPAQRLPLPAHGRRGSLPPDGPELTPLARVRRALTAARAGRPCPTREGPQADIALRRQGDEAAPRHSLPHDPDRVEAMHALCPS
jgi:hypothetical protein